THRTGHVIAVERLGLIELQRRVHENEQAEPRALGPEWLEFGRIEIKAVRLRRDHHAGKAEFVFAARQLAQSLCAPEGIGMRGADEATGIIAFSFLGALISSAPLFALFAPACAT